MNATYTAVDQGTKTQRQAAKEFSVPQSTLQKLLDGKSHIGAKPGKKPLLGNETETKWWIMLLIGLPWALDSARSSSLIMLPSWPANIRLSSRQESRRRISLACC